MTALAGFDTVVQTAVVNLPITLGATLLSATIPAKYSLGGLDMDVSDLDTSTSPVIALDIGDTVDDDRFVADDITARTGGLLEYRPASEAYYRYTAAGTLTIKVAGAPATGAVGAVAIVAYVYPSVDSADLVRRTLQGMGVLAEGETARFEDAALALEALDEVHQMLRGKGLANRQDLAWPVSQVPVFASRPYAAMAGNLLADTFGLSTQRAARLAQRAAEAEREIRRQTYVKYEGNPVDLEPYRTEPAFVLDYGQLT